MTRIGYLIAISILSLFLLTEVSLADDCAELAQTAPKILQKSSENMEEFKVLRARMLIVSGDRIEVSKVARQGIGVLSEQLFLSQQVLAIMETVNSIDGACGLSADLINQYVTVHSEFVKEGPRLIERLKQMVEVMEAP